MLMQTQKLFEKINAIAPITGISFGDYNDKKTWRVDYITGPTLEQSALIAEIIARHQFSSVAEDKKRAESGALLDGTDWKVVRHLEELAYGVATTLTREAFYTLCSERNMARLRLQD